jgi:HD-like signal output (HDOD) protein
MAGPVPDDFLCSADDLVTTPEVAQRVAGLADADDTDAEAFGRVASFDPALTARLLTAANDAHWGQSGLVDSIPAAVTILGSRRTRELSTGLPSTRTFPGIPAEIATMEGYWSTTLLVAIAAREIALLSGKGRPSVAFVAGLLHDIGQLAMLLQAPAAYREALETWKQAPAGRPLDQCERQRMSFDHAQVGAKLLSAWGLPASLQACVAFHHQPERASSFRTEVAIVHVANSLASLAVHGRTDFQDGPPVAHSAWIRIGLDPAQGLAILPVMRRQLDEARGLFAC